MALSSYYEGDQDADIDDDDIVSTSPQPPQAPTSLFGSTNEQNKNDSKNKDRSKTTAGGARIMTLDNMASDDEEDDGTGQVSQFIVS